MSILLLHFIFYPPYFLLDYITKLRYAEYRKYQNTEYQENAHRIFFFHLSGMSRINGKSEILILGKNLIILSIVIYFVVLDRIETILSAFCAIKTFLEIFPDGWKIKKI